MGVLPLYHMYGMIILLQHTIYLGGTVVLMPKFDLPKYCEAIQTYRATVRLSLLPHTSSNPTRRRLSSFLLLLSDSPRVP